MTFINLDAISFPENFCYSLAFYFYKLKERAYSYIIANRNLVAIDKFPSAIDKLMIGKTLAREEITNAMIGNDVLTNYW